MPLQPALGPGRQPPQTASPGLPAALSPWEAPIQRPQQKERDECIFPCLSELPTVLTRLYMRSQLVCVWVRGMRAPMCLAASVVSGSQRPCGLQPASLLCLGDSLGKNPQLDCHILLQGVFPTLGSNPHLLCPLHCQTGSSPV